MQSQHQSSNLNSRRPCQRRARLKQLANFNKTRHDRKENNGKQRKASTKTTTRKKRKVNDILADMAANHEEDEELSGSELLDDNQQESLNLPQLNDHAQYNPQIDVGYQYEPMNLPINQASTVSNHGISTQSSSTAFARSYTEFLSNDDYTYNYNCY